MQVVWVKAHITPVMQEVRQVSQCVLNGNEAADALAKRGAKLVDVTQKYRAKVLWLESVAWRVRRRILAIQMFMVEHHGEDKEDSETRRKAHFARKLAEKRKRFQKKEELLAAKARRTFGEAQVRPTEPKRKWPDTGEGDAEAEPRENSLHSRLLEKWKRAKQGLEGNDGSGFSPPQEGQDGLNSSLHDKLNPSDSSAKRALDTRGCKNPEPFPRAQVVERELLSKGRSKETLEVKLAGPATAKRRPLPRLYISFLLKVPRREATSRTFPQLEVGRPAPMCRVPVLRVVAPLGAVTPVAVVVGTSAQDLLTLGRQR